MKVMESLKFYDIICSAIVLLLTIGRFLMIRYSARERENGWFSNRKSKGEYKELPPDILIRIFSALPMTSIPSVMLVCKDWHDVLYDEDNMKLLHCKALERKSSYLFVGPDEDRISIYMLQEMGNNNSKVTNLDRVVRKWGMGCDIPRAWSSGFYLRFYNVQHSLLYLCNPLIGKRVLLPKIPNPRYNPDKTCPYPWEVYGLAIDLINANLCKAVRIFCCNWDANDDEPLVECEVYTLGTNSWRHVGFITQRPTCRQVYCNRALYWRAGHSRRGIRYIVVFDIATERLNVISGPTSEEQSILFSALIELNKEVVSVLTYSDRTCVHKLEDPTQGKWCMLYRFSPSFFNDRCTMNLYGSWDRGSLIGTYNSKVCYFTPDKNGKIDASFDKEKLNFIDNTPRFVPELMPYFPSLLHPNLFWAR